MPVSARVALVFTLVLTACIGDPVVQEPVQEPAGSTPSVLDTTPAPDPSVPAEVAHIEVARIMATARAIVDGPREATSAAYRVAAREVERRLAVLGYDVRRMPVDVPAGRSWGIPVPAGRTRNVIAEPPGFDPAAPHLIVGAHLDTVPQAPGANDNASGVAVMIELARLAMTEPTPTPIVFIAFGAEEPRIPGSSDHYFGSRAYVAAMSTGRREAVSGMLALDRVGIGDVVRVCTIDGQMHAFARRFLRHAARLATDAEPCESMTSDHRSFAHAGIPGVRLLGAEHPTYHTARDMLDVLERAQLRRMAAVAWETLRRV
jgi:hypothetical protein